MSKHIDNFKLRLGPIVAQLEEAFPNRIHSYYLTGSAVTGTMVAGSDLDIIVVFKGMLEADDALSCQQLGQQLGGRLGYELDLEPVSEAALLREGATGLKLTAVPLHGSDIRKQIPWEPLATFQRDVAAGFVEYASQLRQVLQLSHPLAYPDPQDFLFGYARNDTRLVLKTVLIGATLRVLLASGVRCGSKADAVIKYEQHIGDRWSAWLATLHEQCKMVWEYRIPKAEKERQQLRELLKSALAFENETLQQMDEEDVSHGYG
ncbi:MAG: nucleotidyltransferase domain-containing protein [Chloroflexota bacterium]